MQYGASVSTYKRANENKKDKGVKIRPISLPMRIVFCFIGAILISRVMITVNIATFESIAPFGIAFVLAYSNREEKKMEIIAAVGVLIGYITMTNKIGDIPLYIAVVAILTILQNMPVKIKSKAFEGVSFISIFICMVIFRGVVSKYTIDVNLITAFVQTVVIYPIYYIIKYAISCIEEMNTNHYYSSEEIISISLLICLIISGIGDFEILSVNIRNIIALLFVICTAYVAGSSIGAAAGITLGVIVGIATNNMMLFVSVYGICGLVIGIFKDTGKIFSAISYLVMYFILVMYSQNFLTFKSLEALTACVLFLLIPSKIYKNFALEFDGEKKNDAVSDLNLKKIKEEFSQKLSSFTEVLSAISVTMDSLVDNDTLELGSKGTAMVENLADRVCGNCDMKHICWKREMHTTYKAFSELIRNYQEGNGRFPLILKKKCMREHALIKNTEEIVSNYVINEMIRKRMIEGRKLLAGHINNMAVTIGEITDDFTKEINISNNVEKVLRKEFARVGFKFDNILCYEDRNNRLNIKIVMDDCEGRQVCVKELLPIINQTISKNMSVGGEGCTIDPVSKKCTVLIEEAPKFHVSSHAAVGIKDGEKYTGDTYSFTRGKDGNYIVILSDGMGSGPKAGEESRAAVELIEKFISAGFENLTAINTVNSIMSMKFSEDEKFSTLDMHNIDLYTGNATFMKVGAVETFIKRGERVFVINSNTLPFGVLDKADIDIEEKKLLSGDIIVTISDGVLEIGGDRESNYKWIIDFLGETKIKNPKELSYEILDIAKQLSDGKCKDDMTVISSKIIELN